MRVTTGKHRLVRVRFIATIVFLLACVSHIGAQTSAPIVSKVEPPSWWAGHTINPVRLLVRGQNLQDASIQSTTAGTHTSNLTVNKAGTYAFVDVAIKSNSRPGSYPLKLETAAGETIIPFTILPSLSSATHFQGITPNDVIYLIMPDRFADGDASNNIPPGAPAAATDRRNARAYHGGDLRGVINHLDYLKNLGVTALWLTPWYDNWNGVNRCGKPWCPNTYYHGYHTIDYYAVEDHFGDFATLRELIEKAHARGLKVIQDQVANHVGSQHPWVKDSPLPDWFHGTLAHHSLNRFKNSALIDPHANPDEVRNTLDGWFSDDLPDMNQEQPEVARYEIQNSLWWVGVTGIDGIRQDTIQYLPRAFIRDLSNALHRQFPKMWMVGEVFERNAAQTAFFIGGHRGWDSIDTKLDSVFDFPVWDTSLRVFTNKAPMRALGLQLANDSLYPDALKVTAFANNHDTARFMSLEGATLAGAKMHLAFTLAVRGTPQLYYGEEIAMEGKADPDNRRDFPGGFRGDPRDAFTPSGRTSTQQEMFAWTRSWLQLRAQHPALRQGKLLSLMSDDDAYVFARRAAKETVIIAFNRETKEKTIRIALAGLNVNALRVLLGPPSGVRVERGTATFTIPGQTAIALGSR
jgi:glycosidase